MTVVKTRKMVMVVNQVKMDDEDELDVVYWLNRNSSERLAEVARLRKQYYTWLNGSFPEKMVKVVQRRVL